MLREHYRVMEQYPLLLARYAELVVCDDASDAPAFHPTAACRVDVRVFRIDPPHVPWSHRCATNIAARHARGEWLLLTDIDHLLTPGAAMALVGSLDVLDSSKVYTLERRSTQGTHNPKRHPDTWLIHRDAWRRMGGWDERYRGFYGQNARHWERVRHWFGEPVPLQIELTEYTRADVPDASSPPEAYGDRITHKRQLHMLRRQFTRAGTLFASHQLTVPYREISPC